MVSSERRKWLTHIRERGHRAPSAFVHPKASVIGRVVLGDNVHIAAESSVRADEGSPFFIGPHSNIQDGVVIHALKDRFVQVAGEEWAVYIGRKVSVAHNALIHGPCYIGDRTFVGFKAVVHDSVVGAGCHVGIGSVVVGVEVADGRSVPKGAIVDTQKKADALPPVSEAQTEFNEDVVEVNRGLAAAYQEHHGTGAPPTARGEPKALRVVPPAGWEPPTAPDDLF
jgi:sulfate permease, SulP family